MLQDPVFHPPLKTHGVPLEEQEVVIGERTWQNRFLFNPFVINCLLKELRSLLHSFRSPLLVFIVY